MTLPGDLRAGLDRSHGGPARVALHVAGILRVNVPGADRLPRSRAEIREALERFEPGVVELLDGHNEADRAAPVVGWLDSLELEADGSLRFDGRLADPIMAERVRLARHVPVSPELRTRGLRRANTAAIASPRASGLLVAVAILPPGARPAYPGSVLWPVITREEDPLWL